ncbi:MAG: hypothetical protein AB8B99_09740 [Phormidesmis sp.]
MKLNQWILFFSGVVSALLISTAYQSPIVAQGVSEGVSEGVLLSDSQNFVQRPIQPSATERITQANPVRTPSMVMNPAEGRVSVQIINQTADDITYQALGDTEPRVLAANSATTLQGLHVPATVTFAYKDIQKNRSTGSGLTKVSLRTNEAKDHLDLVVQPTDSLDADASNLTIESSGNVFIF